MAGVSNPRLIIGTRASEITQSQVITPFAQCARLLAADARGTT